MALSVNVTKEDILAISGANIAKCMRCGKCSATCPAYDEMEYHPHEFVAMVENGEIEELMRSNGIYRCLSCMACLERCPRQVEPARIVEAIRLAVTRMQDNNHLQPEDIPGRLDADMPQQLLVSAFRKYSKS